ncbi:cytosine permease [Bacillus sp. DTU_2020_1000418_1_SI_GHA_SEK_038]|uniref:cytosine permease n=1 Tax=Bacillus sp. DTU_2020_1000418_1_SI_GHA_SEK_038 TaxID=3077585 RepID=UPI0028ED5024|nr:cytosine permease [Bacillus sp. DTU_2020_1000418_1_SI_GHA_SEK_038]WNS73701.1 cytosine permease [Bacillus sp. DTU_2020_1000418_1_SI_GHA_SEK_038]
MINFQAKSEHDLYSESLAPVEYSKRKIGSFGIGVIWFGIAVQVTSFLVMTPLVQYYTIGELVWINLIGQLLVCLACFVTQEIGLKYGVSFATTITAVAGPLGGKIVGLVRAMPAIIFVGLNGFIGATAINMFMTAVFGFSNMLVAIIINAILLILVTISGAKGIERFTTFAAPLMIIIGGIMFYVLMKTHSVSLIDVWDLGRTGGTSKSWLYGFGVCLGGYAAVAMGFNDFTKDCTIKNGNMKKAARTHLISYIIMSSPAFMFFTMIGIITVVLVPGMTGSEVLPYLTELVAGGNNLIIAILALFVFVAQLSTNTAANLFPSVYVICALAPKKINFKTATVIVGVLAFVLQPWKFGPILDVFLAVFGAAGGPALAIIAVDYYYFRKRKYSLGDLFNSRGKYFYWHGINPVSLSCYVSGIIIGLLFLDYNYFVSLAATSVLYIFAGNLFAKKFPVMVSETAEDLTNFTINDDSKIDHVI